jgi:hypothetical protein
MIKTEKYVTLLEKNSHHVKTWKNKFIHIPSFHYANSN